MRFSCWGLRTSGDKSWRGEEGGGAANAKIPNSKEAVNPSTLKAFIAIDAHPRPVVAWHVKGSNEHALVIATLGPRVRGIVIQLSNYAVVATIAAAGHLNG